MCGFQGPVRARSRHFSVAIARGPHLFPFRTEQLSPAAPMVLGTHVPGRVGRRRFFFHEPPTGRLVVVNGRAVVSRAPAYYKPGRGLARAPTGRARDSVASAVDVSGGPPRGSF